MKTFGTVCLWAVTLAAVAQDYTRADCPVVGNINSKIYHKPGNSHYAMMLIQNKKGHPDNRQCFPTAGAAEQAGYRAAKN